MNHSVFQSSPLERPSETSKEQSTIKDAQSAGLGSEQEKTISSQHDSSTQDQVVLGQLPSDEPSTTDTGMTLQQLYPLTIV